MKKDKNVNIRKNNNIKQSRRSFINNLWIALGAIAGIEVLGISINFLLHGSKKKNKDTSLFVIAGKVEDFKLNSVTPLRSGRYYVVRMQDGGFLAMSLKCTHLGCSIEWNKEKKRFVCPCHSSSFAMNGNVINPPAPRALDLFPIAIENDVVKVNPKEKIKRRRFSNSQVTYIES